MGAYIHHVPGRLRVKTPMIKRNLEGAASVSALLRAMDGVSGCEVNVTTGSILVRYDRDAITPERVMETLRREGYLQRAAELLSASAAVSPATSVVETVGRAVAGFLVEKMVERSAVALIAAIL